MAALLQLLLKQDSGLGWGWSLTAVMKSFPREEVVKSHGLGIYFFNQKYS